MNFLPINIENDDGSKELAFINIDNIVWLSFQQRTIKTVDGGIWPMDDEVIAILLEMMRPKVNS